VARDDALRSSTLSASRGTFRARFERPAEPGDYRVVFEATALTGQRSSTEAVRTVPRRPGTPARR
jgi:hypothetical protein